MMFQTSDPLAQQLALGDTASGIAWQPESGFYTFAVSSWDSKVQLYTINPHIDINSVGSFDLKASFSLEDAPLSVSWNSDGKSIYSGLINGNIAIINVQKADISYIKAHDDGVISVYHCSGSDLIVSISYDKTIKIWDLKAPENAVFSCKLNYKPIATDLQESILAIALNDGMVAVIDLSNPKSLQNIVYTVNNLGVSSPLHSIAVSQNLDLVLLGSIDGRSNFSNIIDPTSEDTTFSIKSFFTFKCHKKPHGTGGTKFKHYPVHSVHFHPINTDVMITAGGDGTMCLWNYVKKQKTKEFPLLDVPCTAAKFSLDGEYLAYATGYDWGKGVAAKESLPANICFRKITKEELDK